MTLLLAAKLTFNPQVTRWLDRLHVAGIRVVCLHIGCAEELQAIRARLHGPVHCLFEHSGQRAGIASAWRLFSVYRRVLAAERPDVVWMLGLWTLAVPLVWALQGRIPLVITACGSDVNIGARRWRNRVLFRYLLSKSALVCALIPEMMARLRELASIRPGRELTLDWGIDTDIFVPADAGERAALRRKWGVASDAPVIYMGRFLRPIACYREALSAIAAMARPAGQAAPKLVFINWASDTRVVGEVRGLIEELGLGGQVVFIDRELDARELREIYAISDITLNLLWQDQLGATIFEAIAAGSLLVTTDLPQYRRVAAEGARFWFVRTGSVEADLVQVLGGLVQDLPSAKTEAVARNREVVRARHRFETNSTAFMNALRAAAGRSPQVSS